MVKEYLDFSAIQKSDISTIKIYQYENSFFFINK